VKHKNRIVEFINHIIFQFTSKYNVTTLAFKMTNKNSVSKHSSSNSNSKNNSTGTTSQRTIQQMHSATEFKCPEHIIYTTNELNILVYFIKSEQKFHKRYSE